MDTFFYSGKTWDGFSIAACGFCADGEKKRIENALETLRNVSFGNYTAAYIIDYRLNQMVKEVLGGLEEEVYVLGASIRVPGAEARTGGIFGTPGGEAESADDIYQELERRTVGIRPGYMAFCLEGAAPAGLKTAFFLAESREDIFAFYRRLEETEQEFVLMTDGSGKGAFGVAAVRRRIAVLEEISG